MVWGLARPKAKLPAFAPKLSGIAVCGTENVHLEKPLEGTVTTNQSGRLRGMLDDLECRKTTNR